MTLLGQSVTIEKISLRKSLRLLYAPNNLRKRILREDIRSGIKKASGEKSSSGQDFHVPFWADAKKHIASEVDLREEAEIRINRNRYRSRLYKLLTEGFLTWWDEKRRWRNEPFEFVPQSIRAQLQIPELGIVIKIENLLALKIGDQSYRIIYPYFCEEPTLSEDGARIGLWLLSEALPDYDINDMHILDVLRSTSFAISDVPLRGSEREMFVRDYDYVLNEWRKLKEEY